MNLSMLSPPSQVLLRNKEYLTEGRWLLVNPADSQIFEELVDCQLAGFHQYYQVYQACLNCRFGSQQNFGAEYKTDEPFDGAVIYLAKAKQHNQMLLANIATQLKPGGQLLLVGENKAGIKSAGKMLEKFGRPQKVDSARHCALYAVVLEKPAQAFDIQSWCQQISIEIDELTYPIVTLPGVFSSEHLDSGTQLLLQSVI